MVSCERRTSLLRRWHRKRGRFTGRVFACSSEGWGKWALGGLEAALLVAVLAEEADEVGAEGEDALVLGGEIGGVF